MTSVDQTLIKHGINPDGLTLDEVVSRFGYNDTHFRGTHIQAQDFIHVAVVGIISGLSAYYLKDVLKKFHDGPEPGDPNVFKRIRNFLDHSGNPIDGPGFDIASERGVNPIKWHRTLYGHDIFNFKEGWLAYIEKHGDWFSGSMEYIRHMVADTFSSQGLPIPGHSFFRDQILQNFTADQIPKFLTIKARDVAADALSMLYAAVANKKRATSKRDYHNYELAIANRISSLIGIFATTGCLNPVDIFLVGIHSARLFMFEMRVTEEIHAKVGLVYQEVQALCREPILDYDEEYSKAQGKEYRREDLFFDTQW